MTDEFNRAYEEGVQTEVRKGNNMKVYINEIRQTMQSLPVKPSGFDLI